MDTIHGIIIENLQYSIQQMQENNERHQYRKTKRNNRKKGEKSIGIIGINYGICLTVGKGELIIGSPGIMRGFHIAFYHLFRRIRGIYQNVWPVKFQEHQWLSPDPFRDLHCIFGTEIIFVNVFLQSHYTLFIAFLLKSRTIEIVFYTNRTSKSKT